MHRNLLYTVLENIDSLTSSETPQPPVTSMPHSAPHSPSSPANKEKKRWRRRRTVFSPEEIAVLEGVYEEQKFLNPALKSSILERVSVPGTIPRKVSLGCRKVVHSSAKLFNYKKHAKTNQV